MAQGGDGRHAADRQVAAVHDRRVALDLPLVVEHRTVAGVEGGIVLQRADRRLDGVDRAAAGLEDRLTGGQG